MSQYKVYNADQIIEQQGGSRDGPMAVGLTAIVDTVISRWRRTLDKLAGDASSPRSPSSAPWRASRRGLVFSAVGGPVSFVAGA